MNNIQSPFPIGTKVRVKGYPLPMGQSVPFDFNGLIGSVKSAERIGFGLNNLPVYSYLVRFDKMSIVHSVVNPTTRKIDKITKQEEAENFFEEVYLEKA